VKTSPSQIAYQLLTESREAIGQAQALYYEGTYSERIRKIQSALNKLEKAKVMFAKARIAK
jgi:hypothetical protein